MRISFAIIAFKQLFSFTILIRIFEFPRIVIMICCKISVGRLGGWLDTWIAVRKCRGDNYSLAALYSNTPQIVNTKRNKYFPSPVLIRTPLFWPFDAAFPARFITAGRLAGFAANLGFYWSFWERQCWQANSFVNIDFHQKHLANRGLASFSTHYDFYCKDLIISEDSSPVGNNLQKHSHPDWFFLQLVAKGCR